MGGAYTFSGATATEIGYLSGVTFTVQSQLNGKLSSSGGTITGSISCTGVTYSCSMTSGKHGVNLGTCNTPMNNVNNVIPMGATSYVINIANTFNGASVSYINVSGSAVFQALNCTQLNMTSNVIILLTAYPSLLAANYLGT